MPASGARTSRFGRVWPASCQGSVRDATALRLASPGGRISALSWIAYRMGTQSRTVEQKLAWFGRRAHGVVTRTELLAAGITPREIWRRIQKGLLIPQYPGVYRVGHAAPSTDASFIAAVKAC